MGRPSRSASCPLGSLISFQDELSPVMLVGVSSSNILLHGFPGLDLDDFSTNTVTRRFGSHVSLFHKVGSKEGPLCTRKLTDHSRAKRSRYVIVVHCSSLAYTVGRRYKNPLTSHLYIYLCMTNLPSQLLSKGFTTK